MDVHVSGACQHAPTGLTSPQGRPWTALTSSALRELPGHHPYSECCSLLGGGPGSPLPTQSESQGSSSRILNSVCFKWMLHSTGSHPRPQVRPSWSTHKHQCPASFLPFSQPFKGFYPIGLEWFFLKAPQLYWMNEGIIAKCFRYYNALGLCFSKGVFCSWKTGEIQIQSPFSKQYCTNVNFPVLSWC